MNETSQAQPGGWHRSLARVVDLASTQRFGLIGLAVTRVAIGVVFILLDLAIHVGDRQGPRRPRRLVRRRTAWSATGDLRPLPLRAGSSPAGTDVLDLASVAAPLFVAGWRTPCRHAAACSLLPLDASRSATPT